MRYSLHLDFKLRAILTLFSVMALTLAIFWGIGQDNITWAAPEQNPNLQTVPPRPPDDPPPPPPPPSAPPSQPQPDNSNPNDQDEDDKKNEEETTPILPLVKPEDVPSNQSPNDDGGQDTSNEALPAEPVQQQTDTNTANNLEPTSTDEETGEGVSPLTSEEADLSLTKSVNNPLPVVGQIITYTVVVSNSGPDAATNVFIREVLPNELTFVSAAPTQGNYNPATGRWQFSAIASGETFTLTLAAQVAKAGEIANTAEVVATFQFDPDSAPNNQIEAEDDQYTVLITVSADKTTVITPPESDLNPQALNIQSSSSPLPFSDWSGLLLWLFALVIGIILVFMGIFLVHRA
jgi:uncharacterized repeat protein (TIGR01451 family)